MANIILQASKTLHKLETISVFIPAASRQMSLSRLAFIIPTVIVAPKSYAYFPAASTVPLLSPQMGLYCLAGAVFAISPPW